jgi:hypothetical protein
MRSFFAILLFAAAIQTAPATAQTSASPLLGAWAVDVSRLPMPPEARPKSVKFTLRDAGAGKWTTNVDILGGDGSERHMATTYVPDGTPALIEGDKLEADTAAVKVPVPNVMVLELVKGGAPASTRVYTVAADGKTMIETAAYVGGDGRPVMRTNYFNRVR